MTKQEKEIIKKAINRLCDDDGWHDGIIMLKKLLNPNYKSFLDNVEKVNISDISIEKE